MKFSRRRKGSSLLLTLLGVPDKKNDMSRPLRIEYPGAWYHVMNRGRRGERVFRNTGDYRGFIEILKDARHMWNLRVTAYCLMPSHYHILVQTPDGNLSRSMRHVDGVYTQRFNRSHGTDGPLFRGRYKSILVEVDSYLLPLVRYIHTNPLNAGLVNELQNYEWGSHRGYLSNAPEWDWLHKDLVYSMLSDTETGRLNAYRKFMQSESEARLERVLESKKWPAILGADAFLDWVKERFFQGKMDDEVPQSKELTPDVGKICDVVCRLYQVDPAALLRSRRGVPNEPRNMAIYLTRLLRRERLQEIGKHFGVSKCSSVSSTIERVKAEMIYNERLKQKYRKLVSMLIKS